jgi:predicted metalloprotease
MKGSPMRLDDFDPNAIDVGDQSGGRMRMPGRGGQVGCGTLVVVLIAAAVFGVDPAQMLGQLGEGAPTEQQEASAQGEKSTSEICTLDPMRKESCDTLSSLNKTWEPLFAAAGIAFKQPGLRFYAQSGMSGCGTAQSAMGPFYCPADQRIYIDTDFYREMDQKLGAGGDFARSYVIAHEYGHHVQTITGISDQIRSLQQQNPRRSNQLQVRMELQADCYAGVWAARNKDRIEPGDMEEGLTAAHSIGDDTLMKSAGRRPVEASFTHGSSAQRVEALRRGLQSGDDSVCDVYMQ